MTDLERRLLSLEAAISGRAEPVLPGLDVAAVLEAWRELRSQPPAEPYRLRPDIALMTDREAVAEWRRLCRR